MTAQKESVEASDGKDRVTLRVWIGVMGTILGAFMAVLDIQITNSSLRDITGGIAATQDEGSWISTSYLIGEIVTIPLTGWLSRVFGVQRYLLVNVGLFLLFSCLCGISRSLGEMIFFRAGQGFTGGVMIPVALTVALSTLPKSKLPFGLALFGMTATFGPVIGPTIGGWLTDNFGWQWVFYLNLLPGALMIGAIVYAIDRKTMQLDLLREGDWIGISAMAIGLGSLIAMLEEGQRKDWFGSQFIQRCGILAAIFIPGFVIIELARKKPFVNLRLLGTRNLGISSAVNFFLGLALYGSVYLHDFRIGENVNTFRLAVQSRVEQITSAIMAKGYDPVTATKGAYAQMKNVVRREAYVMAFNDAFLVVMIGLLISAVLVWFCQKTTTKDGMAQ
jgi:MFS transporter, DHA2 family, multidrug resistance protein